MIINDRPLTTEDPKSVITRILHTTTHIIGHIILGSVTVVNHGHSMNKEEEFERFIEFYSLHVGLPQGEWI